MEQKVSNDRLTELIEKYSDMVYRIAYANAPNTFMAEDIYQEVFIKLVEHVSTLESEEHIKYWLIRVTMNYCKKAYRHTTNVEYMDAIKKEDVDEPSVYSSEEEYLKNEQRQTVRKALKQLSPIEYQMVLYLFYFEQLSIEQISGILNKTPGATKTKLSRARTALKRLLQSEYGEVMI